LQASRKKPKATDKGKKATGGGRVKEENKDREIVTRL